MTETERRKAKFRDVKRRSEGQEYKQNGQVVTIEIFLDQIMTDLKSYVKNFGFFFFFLKVMENHLRQKRKLKSRVTTTI